MEIDFTPSPELYPFESRWFDSSVGRVHYIDEGKGRPILFCHGNPTWSFLYRHIVKALRDRFRCVAVDYPGFGLSVRPEGYGYTIAEHAKIAGEFVDHLELEDLIVMGQDWGGPIGTSVAASRADRVSGLVLGNTGFWPFDTTSTRLFSRIMSSGFMQRRILEKNFFVERLIPMGTARTLTDAEMEHYRAVQPTPEARRGVAEMPKQIIAAGPWLAELAGEVQKNLADKPALLVWGMKDFGFRPKAFIPRIQQTFADNVLVELPRAKHYIQEDAPQEIATAIADRFGEK